VKTALLDAATALYAERGPRAVSIRDVAARAGVNHGLVHRHFGSKTELLRAVLDRLVGRISGLSGKGALDPDTLAAVFVAAAQENAYWRVLARALLDGEHVATLQSDFPLVRRLVATFRDLARRGELAAEFDPEVVAGGAVALSLGWLLFEPFLLEATSLKRRGPAAARGALLATMQALLARMHPLGRTP
jgi:AcrR family transcriptional regulator